MANTIAVFTPYAAEFPTSSAVTSFPQMARTAGATTNGYPRPYLGFDASTTETCMWTAIAPQGLTGTTITALITGIMASAITGGICLAGSLEAVTPGDVLYMLTTDYYGTVTTATANVPKTTAAPFQVSIVLADADSIAAGDYYRFKLARHHAATADNAAGDFEMLAVELTDG